MQLFSSFDVQSITVKPIKTVSGTETYYRQIEVRYTGGLILISLFSENSAALDLYHDLAPELPVENPHPAKPAKEDSQNSTNELFFRVETLLTPK